MTRPLPPKIGPTEGGMGHAKPSGFCGLPGFEPKLSAYRIYLNRRRGVYFIFRNPAAAFIQKSLYSVLNIVLHMLTFLLGDSNKSLHSQQNYALQKFLKENLTQEQKSTVTLN